MTQNFNRYTYALNNPLAYTDNDGEFFHFILGALIGVVTNGISNLVHGQPFFKGAIKSALIGGIAGAAISYGTYHLTKYYAYKQSNANVYGINDYKTYARISSDIQRSRIWHKEYGGVLTDQGYFRAPGWARHNYGVDFDSKWLSSVKGNPKAIFHTHWDDAGRNIIVNNSYDLDPNGGFSAITSNGPSVGDYSHIKNVLRSYPNVRGMVVDNNHTYQYYQRSSIPISYPISLSFEPRSFYYTNYFNLKLYE